MKKKKGKNFNKPCYLASFEAIQQCLHQGEMNMTEQSIFSNINSFASSEESTSFLRNQHAQLILPLETCTGT